MSDKLTNAYALHAELSDQYKTVSEERKALTANHYAQQFFTVATWIIYLLFAAAMYAAPLWVLQSFFGANAGNYLAIVVIGVFLVVFPTALALGKHAGYRALSKRGVDPRYMGAIIAFFIASGIYFEMTSASSQQQEKAHQAVENSNAGKAIMGATVSTGTSAYASLIADAEFKLVACKRKLSEGKTKDCNNSQARVDSLKEQSSADRAAAITANSEAITAKQSALEKERESHALPIAKSFAELFGSSVATGAVIAALVAALIFEISHSLTIYNEWRIKKEISLLDGGLKQLKIDYFHNTGKQFDATDFKESEVLDLVEMREKGKLEHFNDRLQDGYPTPNDGGFKKSGIGFTAPVGYSGNKSFGFIPNSRSTESQDAENRRKYPQTIIWPTNDRPTPDDYSLIPRKERQHPSQPLPATVTETVSDTVHARSETVADTVHARSQNGIRETVQNGLTDAAKRVETDLYPAWLEGVKMGEITPGARDCKRFISQNTFKTGDKTVLSVQEMQRIWVIWQSRATLDGILKPNPDYSNGKPKYILAA